MSAKWMERKGAEPKGEKKRSGGPSNKKRRSRSKGKVKKKAVPVGKVFAKNDRLKRVNEDAEPIPLFEPVEVSLDSDPENQDARIEQIYKEVLAIEEDLAPLTDELKDGARKILKESE